MTLPQPMIPTRTGAAQRSGDGVRLRALFSVSLAASDVRFITLITHQSDQLAKRKIALSPQTIPIA